MREPVGGAEAPGCRFIRQVASAIALSRSFKAACESLWLVLVLNSTSVMNRSEVASREMKNENASTITRLAPRSSRSWLAGRGYVVMTKDSFLCIFFLTDFVVRCHCGTKSRGTVGS